MIRRMIVIFLFSAVGLSGCLKGATPRVCFDQKCFAVELAQTPQELYQGLQGRESLAKDSGMLFVFSEPSNVKFWMKDTLIPLDMIWLSDIGEVLYVEHSAPPCVSEPCPSFGPEVPARFVLELDVGSVRAYGINVGDKARLFLDASKR